MTFPGTPLNIVTEILIDGQWTNVSGSVLNRDPIEIVRGRADEGSQVDPGKAVLTLNNKAGKFSPRNPRSPFSGKLGRNTPLRVSVAGDETWLDMPGGTVDPPCPASTPDVAALDITGDLDVRFEGTLANWQATEAPGVVELVGKFNYVTVAHRSWLLSVLNRRLRLEWSTDGTTTTQITSLVELPVRPYERAAVRATLDVDNGDGESVVRFFTAETMAGPWEALGDPVTLVDSRPIFSSDAELRIGDGGQNLDFPAARGRCHAIEVRAGINGTVVANPEFAAQPVGTASFVDGAGRTWTVGTEITNRNVRFEGEVVSWPQYWDVSGADVWTSVEAVGISRRLGQGSKERMSALRRRVGNADLLAYWPMEEDEGATVAYSPTMGVQPASTEDFAYGGDESPAGSAGLPAVGEARPFLSALVPTYTDTGEWHVEWVYKLDEAPEVADPPNNVRVPILRIRATGEVKRHFLYVDYQGSFTIRGYDTDPNEGVSGDELVYDHNIGGPGGFGKWNRMRLSCKDNGNGTSTVSLHWTTIGGGSYFTTKTYTGKPGRVSRIYSEFDPKLKGMGFGHLSASSFNQDEAYNYADHGWLGEEGDVRLSRVADESGVPMVLDAPEGLPQMGPQRPATFMDTVQECAGVDGGVISETREGRGLWYRSRTTIYNQDPTLDLEYGQAAPLLLPVDDDQGVRNDVTVSRVGGSRYRAQNLDGPLSVQDPPYGVGRYDEAVEVNAYTDDQLSDMANWFVHLGSWDESRYPVIRVNLAQTPELKAAVCRTDLLDRIRISNPPAWLPPDPIDALVQGYTERLSLAEWEVEYNCSPHRPWNVGRIGGDSVSERFEDDAFHFTIDGGGDLPWVRSSEPPYGHTGLGYLRSGAIGANQTSDAIVRVPANAESMSVWYRTSCEAGDALKILADDTVVKSAGGVAGWARYALDVAGLTTVTFRYDTDGTSPHAPVVEDFEDTTYNVTITNGGNLAWARTSAQKHSGSWSLKSGAITNNQTSDAVVAVPSGATSLTYWYRTSSENSGSGFLGDRLLVIVGGVTRLTAQGNTGWTQHTVNVAGQSSVTFRYAKDNSSAAGEDMVYVDDLTFSWAASSSDDAVYVDEVTFTIRANADETVGRADTDGSVVGLAADDVTELVHVTATDGPLWVTGRAPEVLNGNPSFADDTDPWTAYGGELKLSDNAPVTGVTCGRFEPNGMTEVPSVNSDDVQVTSGGEYVLGGWLRCDVARVCRLDIDWFGPGFSYLGSSEFAQSIPAGEWVRFEQAAVAPVGAVTAKAVPLMTDTPPSSHVLYVDDVEMYRVEVGSDASTEFPFDVNVGGEWMKVHATDPYGYDTFGRSLSGTWGTTDTGESWVPSGTVSSSELSVAAGAGKVTLQAPNSQVRFLQLLEGLGDCEVAVTVALDQSATGGQFLPGIFLRASGSLFYWVSLGYLESGAISLAVRDGVTAVGSSVTTGAQYAPGSLVRTRARVVGNTVYAKVWNVERHEPGEWQIIRAVTGGVSPVGAVGVVACATSTNTAPVFSFSDFRIESPQRFTVTRGVNGLTMPHNAGTDVRLAVPTLVAW